MITSLYDQIKILIIFAITGIIIGLLFDFFRIQRKVINTFDFITYLQDALFWILSGIVLIISIMNFTNGEIRSYMILGIIIGVVLYFNTFSKYIMKISVGIANFFIKILHILISPIKKLSKKLKKSWKKKDNML